MHEQRLFFCYKCGNKLQYTQTQPKRLECSSCHTISYENPIVGVAGIILNEKKEILMAKRAKGVTYEGLWCIPCGYVEYDEDVYDAIEREIKEETGLIIKTKKVFTVKSNFHNPKQHTVGIWFLCKIMGGTLCAGDDAEEVEWFPLDNIPPLAFPTDSIVLSELATFLF